MKKIISASRRTDMPAYYMEKLIYFIEHGLAEVSNPYSGRISQISLNRENVHTIVLWSKNFRKFIENRRYFNGYNLYFLFTLNDMPSFESNIPSLSERILQVGELTDEYGPERVCWRFDPIVKTETGWVQNIDSFRKIAEKISGFGVKRVIFSFVDLYGKVITRNRAFSLGIIEPSAAEKKEFACRIAEISGELGLEAETCCEDIGMISGISAGSCINGDLLSHISGETAETGKDKGQRKMCGCTPSRDIGSYGDMPCPGGCLYCYANPVIENSPLKSVFGGGIYEIKREEAEL